MFLAETLTTLVQGMKRTFTDAFPVEEFRDLHVGIEYPVEQQHYPSIWVDFEPMGPLRIAGINHTEFLSDDHGVEDEIPRFGEVTRWVFEGQATFTIVSLSALSRARLVDEVIRTLGFGRSEHGHNAFHEYVDNHELIAMTVNSDDIPLRGMAASPGTPWGSDDVVYEVTLASSLVGEFTSDPKGSIVPLSEIHLYATPEDHSESTGPDGWVV